MKRNSFYPCKHKEHEAADFCVGFPKKQKLEQAVIKAAKRMVIEERDALGFVRAVERLVTFENSAKRVGSKNSKGGG